MGGRPSGIIPVWSSDLNYPAGAQDWSGTPTKVDPGSTAIARGWEPGKSPAAQRVNFLLNRYGGFLQVHDAIEAQNWGPVSEIRLSFDTGFGPTSIAYDPERDWIWVVGGDTADGVVMYSHNGSIWTDVSSHLDSSPSAFQFAGIAFNNVGRGYACETVGGGSHVFLIPEDDALDVGTEYTGFSVTGSGGHHGILRAEEEELFLLFGTSNTNHPAIWTIDDSGTITSRTLTGAGSLTGDVSLAVIATGGPHIVMASISGTWHQWDAPSLTGTWTHRGAVSFASAPRALAFSEHERIFMVVCASGQTYISSDAINWTLRGTAGGSFLANGLTNYGAVWVATSTIPSSHQGAQRHLMYSTNQGQSWPSVAYPLARGTTPGSLARIKDRFAVLGTDGDLSMSLRTP